MLWLWLVLGCSSVDSALVAQRRALDAWEAGTRALEAGQADEAVSHFVRALEHQPNDALLLTWRAVAMAETGERAASVEVLDEVLAVQPGLHEARYHRASYLVQLGRVTEAGKDLEHLYKSGDLDVIEVRSDEAFSPFLDHASLAFLPEVALSVTGEMRTDGAFEGTMVPVHIRVESPWPEPVHVRGRFVGPVEFRSVFERTGVTAGLQWVDLTYRLRVMGPGTVIQGPFGVEQGTHRGGIEEMQFLAVGLEGDEPSSVRNLDAHTPSELLARIGDARARVEGGNVDVRLGGSERARLEPSSPRAPVRYVKEDPEGRRVTLERHMDLPKGEVNVLILLGPRVIERSRVFLPVN